MRDRFSLVVVDRRAFMEAMFSSIPSIFSVKMESLLETSMRRSESWVSGGLVFLALGGMVAGRGERVEGTKVNAMRQNQVLY